jgi:hypothetical protein
MGPTIDPSLLNLDRQIDGFEDVVDGEDEIDSYDVNMCVSNSGNIYVAWRDDREGPSDVWFNRSTDGGANWLPAPRRVKQGRGNATGVHMTCSGERVYVVWEDDRDGETGYENIYLNFTADGGDTWEDDDVSIDADPEGFAISLGPRVVIGQGKVHIVWYDQIEGAPDVYVATSSNAGKSFGCRVGSAAAVKTVARVRLGLATQRLRWTAMAVCMLPGKTRRTASKTSSSRVV